MIIIFFGVYIFFLFFRIHPLTKLFFVIRCFISKISIKISKKPHKNIKYLYFNISKENMRLLKKQLFSVCPLLFYQNPLFLLLPSSNRLIYILENIHSRPYILVPGRMNFFLAYFKGDFWVFKRGAGVKNLYSAEYKTI